MRHDFKYLIYERERAGSWLRSYKTGAKIDPDTDDPGPSRMKLGCRWYGGSAKRRNRRNLNPLRRFLNHCIGQPWDNIYSDIRSRLDYRSKANYDLYNTLKWWVDDLRQGFGELPFGKFFIDQDGIFHKNIRTPRKARPQAVERIRWYGDTWFELQMLEAPAEPCGCVHFKHPLEADGRSRYWAKPVCIHGNEQSKRPLWYVVTYGYHSPDEVYTIYRYEDSGEYTHAIYGLKKPGDRFMVYYRDRPIEMNTPILTSRKSANRKELRIIRKMIDAEIK